MADNKTQETDHSVQAFLESIEDDQKRTDCYALLALMQEVTGEEPRMWGSTIVGFGKYHYKYASGREGGTMLSGFSPRKQSLTLYIMTGFDAYESLLNELGKYTTGKACLYIKTLKDVDMTTLREIIRRSIEHMRNTNPSES